MRRREFVVGLGGAALSWPIATRAQQPSGMRRIGVLSSLAEHDPDAKARLATLRQGLEKRGWSEGRNVRLNIRYAAGSIDQMQVLAKELIALQSEVILAETTPVAMALKRESSTTPIVFVAVSDPIGFGFVENLARPGGNLTGLLQYEASITGKWLGMLKEIAPNLARVAYLGTPNLGPYEFFLRTAQAATPSLGIQLVPSPVENAADIERTIETLAREPNTGLMLPPGNLTTLHRDLIVALAVRHRLPAVYPFRLFVTAGGLMSYGVDRVDMYRQATSYLDRILRGDAPANLPVQAPTKYETVLNLKTAKAIGLTVPPGLLVAADEVIE